MGNLQIRNTCNLRSTKDEHAFWLEGGQSNTALSPALVPLMQDHPSKYLGQNCFPFSRYFCTSYHMFPNFILIFFINRSYFSKTIITWQFFIVFLIVLTIHGPIANILKTIRIVFALIICPVVIEPITQQF